MTGSIFSLALYAATVIPIWAMGTALAFKLIDLLTPMLPFDELAREHPWLLVAILAIAGGCVAYLLKSLSIRFIPVP